MATNIPPHNLGEVIDATLHLIDNPDATVRRPDAVRQGPRLPDRRADPRPGRASSTPTAPAAARSSMRAVAEIEEDRKGGQRIVVTELPYQTSVEVIGAEDRRARERPARSRASATSNESAGRHDRPRHRAEARRQRAGRAQPPLQAHAAADELRREHGRAGRRRAARCSTCAQALAAYVDHQVEVITRRTEYRLQQGAGPRPHRRGPAQGARHDRRDHRPDPRVATTPTRPRTGAAWPRRSSSARSRPSTSSTCRCAGSTQLERPEAARRARRAAARRSPSSRRSSPTTAKLRAVIKDELAEIREKYGDERRTRDHHRPRRHRRPRPHRGRGARRRAVAQGLREDRRRRRVPHAGPRRPGRARRQPARRGLRRAPAHHHRALLPVVLLQPRPGVPAARARDPDEGPHRARHRARQPARRSQPDEQIQAIIDTRTYEDGAYLFFATKNGHGEEDARFSEYDSSLRAGLIAINLNDGDELVRVIQTTGDDDIFMVSRNGHDDPLLRGRRPADGPGHGRRARHEAQERRGRGRELRRGPRRRGDAVRDLQRPRQAHPARRSSTARAAAARACGA